MRAVRWLIPMALLLLPLSVQALAWDDETSLGLARALAEPVGAPPSYRG